jgi:hypothetical protein
MLSRQKHGSSFVADEDRIATRWASLLRAGQNRYCEHQ